MKEHLKENCSVLAFKSDNENFVDFVNTKFPLDYSYYGYCFNDMLGVYQIFYQNATMDLKDLKIKVKEL